MKLYAVAADKPQKIVVPGFRLQVQKEQVKKTTKEIFIYHN